MTTLSKKLMNLSITELSTYIAETLTKDEYLEDKIEVDAIMPYLLDCITKFRTSEHQYSSEVDQRCGHAIVKLGIFSNFTKEIFERITFSSKQRQFINDNGYAAITPFLKLQNESDLLELPSRYRNQINNVFNTSPTVKNKTLLWDVFETKVLTSQFDRLVEYVFKQNRNAYHLGNLIDIAEQSICSELNQEECLNLSYILVLDFQNRLTDTFKDRIYERVSAFINTDLLKKQLSTMQLLDTIDYNLWTSSLSALPLEIPLPGMEF